ncbi:MAG: helix-turn-helix domain-containing protein [Nitrospira sp.]|nr:helix-turn-helix domain-containing protein [Nitrospira sp.]MCA9479980.1 helix-turn-helix domain-containing protein [Nitrospira sp.]MCB9711686.1 helix-turn-helix domain-containing protein [Nitrospiraceae bacterium]MDR4487625.1 DUF4115 domain-containing protein [Nitrospirales bacterium]
MEGFGKFLQEARERKRLSLEDVASQTRIQPKYLEALESENFGCLPGKVFAKGFVRSYAKTIGADEEEALQRFLDASRNFYEQNHLEQQHQQTAVQAEHRGKFNRNLVLGLFVILGVGIFYFLPSQQETQDTTPEVDVPSSPNQLEPSLAPVTGEQITNSSSSKGDSPLPEDSSLPESSTAPDPANTTEAPPQPSEVSPNQLPQSTPPLESSPEPKPSEPTSPTTQIGNYLLEIEATQLTWVVVRSDDQLPNEALLQPGQRITWKASKQFLLTLGNAAGVVVRLNGEPQGPFGKPGQVVRDILIKP